MEDGFWVSGENFSPAVRGASRRVKPLSATISRPGWNLGYYLRGSV